VVIEKRILVREVVSCTPDCEHSSKGLESIEVEITWPDNKPDEKLGGLYYTAGAWTLLPTCTKKRRDDAGND
jgi:hypothetical protein